jgi:hypothetical protein
MSEMHPSHLIAELRRWGDNAHRGIEDERWHMTISKDGRRRLAQILEQAAEMIDGEWGPYNGMVYVDGVGEPVEVDYGGDPVVAPPPTVEEVYELVQETRQRVEMLERMLVGHYHMAPAGAAYVGGSDEDAQDRFNHLARKHR